MPQQKSNSCVVIFSGGQDSTTTLFWAKSHFEKVHAITFDYGQRHRIELNAAKTICEKFDFPQTVLTIPTFSELGGNSLTDSNIPVESGDSESLPNSFVPGRNLIFLTFAAAWAWPRKIPHLVTGVCQTDYSGYPDCRQNTMESLSQTLHLGMDFPFQIHTPLMRLTKAQTVEFASKYGAMEALAYSHTCYNGQFPPCGVCPSCILRAKGFEEAGVQDPIFNRRV